MNTRVLIADDHATTRIGIRAILEQDESLKIVAEAKDGIEVVEKAKVHKPDLIFMDISMPKLSGIDATKQILKELPDVKIVALSIHAGEKFVKEMLNAGAAGYLLKEEAPEELMQALYKVVDGNIYLSAEVTRAALNENTIEEESVTYKILRTKLQRPLVLNEYLRRDRITDQLESNVVKPFSLISAGAGYGKSIAVSQWLDQTAYLFTWISLDEEQNDLRIFLTYIVEAIEEIIPGSLAETRKAISGLELPLEKDLSYIFFNELCDIDNDLILVLDDYHKINDSKIHSLLDRWLSFPPPRLHLSIITRFDPPLALRKMNSMERMNELRMDTLSFTFDEVVQLFNTTMNLDLSDKAIQVLHGKTEGWILALRLTTLVLKDSNNIEDVLNNFEGSMQSISDYLFSEVLAKQPKEIQELMLVSSIFNRFCAELLDDITTGEFGNSGIKLIEWLQKSNMFIIDLDAENKWFRYHHLFQQLLLNHLNKKQSKDAIRQFHYRASNWFERNGLLEESIKHALIVEDYDLAAEVVKKHRLPLLNKNNYFRLEKIRRNIPMSVIESDPELLLTELYLQWNHGNFVRLGELETMLNGMIGQVDKDSAIHAESLFFIGFNSLFLREDLASSLKYFNKAMECVPEDLGEPRGILELHYMIFGQLAGLYNKLQQMFYELIDQDLVPLRKNRLYQGFMAASIDQANVMEIDKNISNGIAYAEQTHMKDAHGIISYMSGSMSLRTGKIDKALETLNSVMEERYYVHSRVTIASLTGILIAYCLKGQFEKAKQTLTILENYVKQLGDFYKPMIWSARVRYHMLLGNHGTVKELLKEFKPGVLDLVIWVDIPEITHARALIFEGSAESLELAGNELETLVAVTTALNNRINLYEIKVLQAILFNLTGNAEKATAALLDSLEITEQEGIVMFYVELGDAFLSLVENMPVEIKERAFIVDILKKIKARKTQLVEEVPVLDKNKTNILTKKEMEVLRCITEGLRNQEIADKLFNSEDTIKKHIYNMFQKLHVKNRLSLVTKAKEFGMLE